MAFLLGAAMAIPFVGPLINGKRTEVKATAILTAVTDVDNFASMQSITKCNTTADVNQQMYLNAVQIGKNNEYNADQNATLKVIDLKCINKSEVTNETATTVLNKLKSEASTKSTDLGGIFGPDTSSDSSQNITNNIKNNINMDSITEQTTTLFMKQLLKSDLKQVATESNRANIRQSLTAEMMGETISETVKSNKTVTDAVNRMAAEATSEQVSTFAELLKAIGMFAFIPFIIMAIIIIALVAGAVLIGPKLISAFAGSSTTVQVGKKKMHMSNKKHHKKSHKMAEQTFPTIPVATTPAVSMPAAVSPTSDGVKL